MLAKKLFIALATASLASLTASQGWALTATTGTTSTSTTATSTVSSPGAASELLVTRYSKLAGSTANAQSLVTGLRNGTLVTLAPSATAPAGTPVITFTPTTQKMGFGNIKIALSLAKTTLAKQGITNPTSEQLAAALNGGKITLTNGTVVTMTGILTQRSAGMGWGKIAQTAGVKLGSVVSHTKTDDDRKHTSTTKTSKEDRNDMIAKVSSTKNHSTSDEGRSAHSKSSSSSSGNASGSGNSSSSASSNSGGGHSGSSGSSNGGGKSSGGGNGGGNSGGNGGGNSGGNGGGKK